MSNLSALSLNIPAISTWNQAQIRYSRVRIRPTDCQPLLGASVRNASTLKKEIECVCCRQIENAAVLSDNFKHLSCITDHFDFEAVCLNETILRTALICLKHSL